MHRGKELRLVQQVPVPKLVADQTKHKLITLFPLPLLTFLIILGLLTYHLLELYHLKAPDALTLGDLVWIVIFGIKVCCTHPVTLLTHPDQQWPIIEC